MLRRGALESKRCGNGPSIPQSSIDCGLRHSHLHSPLGQDHTASAILDEPAIAFVDGLFLDRGPKAVGLLVVSIRIAAFEGVSIARPLAHVFQEPGKLLPLSADDNAAAPVVFEADMRGIFAPGAHISPRIISRGQREPVGSFGVADSVGASTTFQFSALCQGVNRSSNDLTAIASAGNEILSAIPLGEAHDFKPTKAHADGNGIFNNSSCFVHNKYMAKRGLNVNQRQRGVN